MLIYVDIPTLIATIVTIVAYGFLFIVVSK